MHRHVARWHGCSESTLAGQAVFREMSVCSLFLLLTVLVLQDHRQAKPDIRNLSLVLETRLDVGFLLPTFIAISSHPSTISFISTFPRYHTSRRAEDHCGAVGQLLGPYTDILIAP